MKVKKFKLLGIDDEDDRGIFRHLDEERNLISNFSCSKDKDKEITRYEGDGLHVTTCRFLQKAEELIENEEFDIYVVDIDLSAGGGDESSGFEIWKKIYERAIFGERRVEPLIILYTRKPSVLKVIAPIIEYEHARPFIMKFGETGTQLLIPERKLARKIKEYLPKLRSKEISRFKFKFNIIFERVNDLIKKANNRCISEKDFESFAQLELEDDLKNEKFRLIDMFPVEIIRLRKYISCNLNDNERLTVEKLLLNIKYEWSSTFSDFLYKFTKCITGLPTSSDVKQILKKYNQEKIDHLIDQAKYKNVDKTDLITIAKALYEEFKDDAETLEDRLFKDNIWNMLKESVNKEDTDKFINFVKKIRLEIEDYALMKDRDSWCGERNPDSILGEFENLSVPDTRPEALQFFEQHPIYVKHIEKIESIINKGVSPIVEKKGVKKDYLELKFKVSEPNLNVEAVIKSLSQPAKGLGKFPDLRKIVCDFYSGKILISCGTGKPMIECNGYEVNRNGPVAGEEGIWFILQFPQRRVL